MATQEFHKVEYISSTLKSNVSSSSSSTGSTVRSPDALLHQRLSPTLFPLASSSCKPTPLPIAKYYNDLDEIAAVRTPSSTKSSSSSSCVFFGGHQRYPSTASSCITTDDANNNTEACNNNNNNNNMLLLVNNSVPPSSSSSISNPNTMVSLNTAPPSDVGSLHSSNPYSLHHKASFNSNSSGGLNGHNNCEDYNRSTRSHEEDVYQDIVYITLRNERQLGTLNLEPVEKRDYCIKELVETEKNYCEALRMILTHFQKPLSHILHNEDRRLIFNNLKSLTDLHSKLYMALCRVCSQPPASQSSSPITTTTNPSPTHLGTQSLFCFTNASSVSNALNNSTTSEGSLLLNSSISSCGTPTTTTTSIYQYPSTASSWIAAASQGYVNESFSLSGSGNSPPAMQHHQPTSSSVVLSAPPVLISPLSLNRPSKCFLAFKDKFLIYGDYCANLPKAQALLDRLCASDPSVAQAVAECQNKANEGRFKLRDLLSLPMQRILKYHLLLGELIKSTGENHEDFEGLKHAHEMMLDIGGYINEVKRDTETLDIIANVQKSIIDLSMPENYELKDYGRLVKDGELKVRCHDDPKLKMKTRYVFIFDKVVLMCKAIRSGHKTYSYKEAIVLENYKIEEASSLSPISKLASKTSHPWSLVDATTQKGYTFYVKSEDIKRKWLEAIERAQDNIRPRVLRNIIASSHRFSMTNVPIATYCAICAKLLRGVWYQSYQCAVCSLTVHKTCLAAVKPCGGWNNLIGSAGRTTNTMTMAKKDTTTLDKSVSKSVPAIAVNGNHQAPPTPSRSKRVIVKAISSSPGNLESGQLSFETEDTIIVYSKQGGNTWYGKNVRTDLEGAFNAALVTELATDSPASSTMDSPTVALRFSFEDPLGVSAAHNLHHSFHSMSTTLPKKFGTNTSMLPPSQPISSSISTMNVPSSPFAVLFDTPNITPPAATSTPNAYSVSGNFFFGSNTHARQQSAGLNEVEANQRLLYGNGFNLEEYAWFAGSMTREKAQLTLQGLSNGAFLVRISPKQKNNYAISIKYNGQVKHMRVCVTDTPSVAATTAHSSFKHKQPWPYRAHLFLSETRYFRTIVDLVRWYQINNLSESFNMVNTKLVWPYKKFLWPQVLGQARALFSFTGTSSANASFLSLKKGDHVLIISRSAEDKGWWKGQVEDRIGYFPMRYVEPTTHDLKMVITNSMAGFEFQQQSASQQNVNGLNTSANSLKQTKPLGMQQSEQAKPEEPAKVSPSVSPFSISCSSSSSGSSSSPTTLSSPVNSDTSSMHSRQASSDAGIEIMSMPTTSATANDNLVNQRTHKSSDLENCFKQMALIQ